MRQTMLYVLIFVATFSLIGIVSILFPPKPGEPYKPARSFQLKAPEQPASGAVVHGLKPAEESAFRLDWRGETQATVAADYNTITIHAGYAGANKLCVTDDTGTERCCTIAELRAWLQARPVPNDEHARFWEGRT